ncbi:MAG: oligoendopeptidase plasmid [Thermomicrobiales bacterium]|nr:oligoendopeptidase plasmid [Thermomicrobiales bacterium]
MTSQNTAEIPAGEVPTRDQIALEDNTWDLSGIYPAESDWEADADRMSALIETVVNHRGALGESATRLCQALDDIMILRQTLERIRVYAALRRDENLANSEALGRYERSVAIAIEAGEALAFVEPELLALPPERLDELRADPRLAPYQHMLDDLARRRPHVRSAEIEQILAQGADVARAPSDAFTALDNADLTFGRVRDETGNEIELTKARHALLLRSKDRETRRRASETFTKAYLDHRHTLAALHGASVRGDVFQARVRNHLSAREAALFWDNVPTAVYDTLVASIRAAQPELAQYLELRKQVLGLDELATYDLVVPLSPEPEQRHDYAEGVDLVLGGLGLLGADYVDDLRTGFARRWVDVHETKGKRSGAYSSGAYAAPPVILMNWNGTMNDVFTLAHEAGHAMHSFYADANLPFHEAGYPIFLAEIASTVNEVLLTWSLLEQTAEDDALGRFAILDRFAETYFGTVVRQTMFAEYEQRVHAMAESGKPLTVDVLNEIYGELYQTYLPGVTVDEGVRVNWARIPHFYRAFYVYQYATGLSAAIAIARAIRDEGEPARERYRRLLASGGRDYPLVLLAEAGVDLTSPRPIEAGLAEFESIVSEMEQIVASGALTRTSGDNGELPQ